MDLGKDDDGDGDAGDDGDGSWMQNSEDNDAYDKAFSVPHFQASFSLLSFPPSVSCIN